MLLRKGFTCSYAVIPCLKRGKSKVLMLNSENLPICRTLGDEYACDFCNACPAVRFYPCNNSPLNRARVFRYGSGDWATCGKCSELVDAAQWSKLAERSFQHFMKHRPVPHHSADAVRLQFSDLVRMFAAHMKSQD